MLSKRDIERMHPYGYNIYMLSHEDMGEFWRLELQFSHKNSRHLPFKMDLDLPKVNGAHLIMDGVERTVLPAITECGIRNRTETLRNTLKQAIERSMCDFMFHGGPPPASEVVEAEFKALIAKSEFIVDTPPHSPLEKKGYEHMIRIDRPEGNPTKTSWREFQESDWDRLDPDSTSQSEKINRVFRKKTGIHCESIGHNAVFSRANPRRTFLTRTAFERHLPQLVPDPPLVANEKNQLSGKNLFTALMDLGNTTFEDSIGVSRSAASALTCVRTIRMTWVGHKPLVIKAPIGNVYQPKALLAKTEDGIEGVHADKLQYPAKLVDIQVATTLKFRDPAYRYIFIFEAELPLRDGDKIAGRHGNKGIAWIVEDRDMPMIKHPTNDRMNMRVDVCLSPISVVKRRMMSLYLEMMAAKKAMAEGRQIIVPEWDIPDNLTFEKLIQEGYGQKDQLYLQGMPLPELTYVGPLYWIRQDKLAVEQVSASRGRVVVNHLGLPINSARVNGQKRDVSKSLAFYHKPIREILADNISFNTLGVKKFESVVQVLEPEFHIGMLV